MQEVIHNLIYITHSQAEMSWMDLKVVDNKNTVSISTALADQLGKFCKNIFPFVLQV